MSCNSVDRVNDVRPPLNPSVAAIRKAVREAIVGVTAASTSSGSAAILVALSGGADSLALAAATAFEAPKAGLRAGAVIVDHGLQEGSADVAERAAEQARSLGLDPVLVRTVEVGADGGPEAAARDARYAALESARHEVGAAVVLLAHTLDDQAETVLLGLARGSGAGSLQGMAPVSGPLLRPLLGIRRAQTHEACDAAELTSWQDPHNTADRFARVRVRERVLPVLEAELGPGIAEALARTADAMREDAEAFEEMIEETIEEIVEHAEAGISVSAAALAANPAALRQRVIRYIVQSEFGVSLSRLQTIEVARLVTDWSGQGPIDLPSCSASRVNGQIVFSAR